MQPFESRFVNVNNVFLVALFVYFNCLRVHFACRGGKRQQNRRYFRQSAQLRLGWRQTARTSRSSSMRSSSKAFLHLVHSIERAATASKVQNAVHLRGKLPSALTVSTFLFHTVQAHAQKHAVGFKVPLFTT